MTIIYTAFRSLKRKSLVYTNLIFMISPNNNLGILTSNINRNSFFTYNSLSFFLTTFFIILFLRIFLLKRLKYIRNIHMQYTLLLFIFYCQNFPSFTFIVEKCKELFPYTFNNYIVNLIYKPNLH